MLADVRTASDRGWHLPYFATRKVPAAEPAMDSLQIVLSLVKVDTTNSVYAVSYLGCQTTEE